MSAEAESFQSPLTHAKLNIVIPLTICTRSVHAIAESYQVPASPIIEAVCLLWVDSVLSLQVFSKRCSKNNLQIT